MISSLNLIIRYCDDVASDIARFGDDIEDLIGDESYQRSTAESIELMGERVKRLSDDVMSRFLRKSSYHESLIRQPCVVSTAPPTFIYRRYS